MSEQAPRHRASHTGLTISAAVVSVLIIGAMSIGMTVLRPFKGFADTSAGRGSVMSQTVSQLQLSSYCPARMGLADTASFGDREFRVSAGNIASAARYSAFGAVYRSTVGGLADDGQDDVVLGSSDQDGSVFAASGDVDKAPTLMNTRLLESRNGTGFAAAMASWATQGDLRGLSATSCIGLSLEHSFLLPGMQTGNTQQLVIANPSSKPTSVRVRVWGTTRAGALKLSTGETVTVKAFGETTVDLSAAAPNQDGLYVTLVSRQTPVASVVRAVSMNGLEPSGSEYAVPLPSADTVAVMPAAMGKRHVTVFAFANGTGDISLSWITDKGKVDAVRDRVEAGKVTVIDLGQTPENALALVNESDQPVHIMARMLQEGRSQRDFAFVTPSLSSSSSAISIPGDLRATISMANPSDETSTATFVAYDAQGRQVGQREVSVPGQSALALDVSDIAEDAVIVRCDVTGGGLAWNASLSSDAVDDADLAGLAVINANALGKSESQITVSENPSIVR